MMLLFQLIKKMAQWVEKFCLKYKTVGKTRKFKSHTGEVLEVSGGDYGWQIDYSQTVDQVYKALTENNTQSDVDAYVKNKSNTNKKKLLKKLEPIYKNKAYKMNFENPTEDYNTQTYSEVDISEQIVYVFQNGQVVYSAKCVTGLPSDAWQPWASWNPSLYKTRGSHGCVNLQLEDVKNIYNLVSMRDMVFIHD